MLFDGGIDSPGYQSRLIDNIYSRRSAHVAATRDRLLRRAEQATTPQRHTALTGQARTMNEIITNRYVNERRDAQAMLRQSRRR